MNILNLDMRSLLFTTFVLLASDFKKLQTIVLQESLNLLRSTSSRIMHIRSMTRHRRQISFKVLRS